MTIAQEIYENSVWGNKQVCCPIEHVKETTFSQGETIVKCKYIKEKLCLYFEVTEKNVIVATYYLKQNGQVTFC